MFENSRFVEARRELEQTLRVAPKHAPALYLLSRIEQKSGNVEAAGKLRARYRELNPE